MRNSKNIVHLIPHEGIGGVERAASTMNIFSHNGVDFHVNTIFPNNVNKKWWVLWNPFFYMVTILKILKSSPEILIVSLWKSCIVGLFIKLIDPKTKLILFLHSSMNSHFLDKYLTILTAYFSNQIWADSQDTLNNRLAKGFRSKAKVVSFICEKYPIKFENKKVSPTFIFWGRIQKQKRLDNALYFFSGIYKSNKDANFIIIGPDCGDLKSVRNLVSNLKLSSAVHFMGPLTFDNIKLLSTNASFYLQTSEREGMALSVVEAMQLGLVPIVTPVGEIKNYCINGFNAIIINNKKNAIDKVRLLLSNVEDYNKYRYNAISSWNNKITYKDDVFNKCLELLNN
jgi:glycosyltransferase involved in cell wall biosynthesis